MLKVGKIGRALDGHINPTNLDGGFKGGRKTKMPAKSKLTTVYIPDSKEEAIKVRALLRKAGVKFHNQYLHFKKPLPYKPVLIRVDEENIYNAIDVIQKMVNDEMKTGDIK